MNIVLLGHGKTGALVADVARERGHDVRVLRSADNVSAQALYSGAAADADVVIDFTTPHVVLANIEACARAGKNMVVGTTGWYGELPRVREMIERAGTGFVFGANFSVGVNVFFEVARSAAAALKLGYTGQIMERHHIHKKDAPSGTALLLKRSMEQAGFARAIDVSATRAGFIPGTHTVGFDGPAETITLTHTARDRTAFARGALTAAKWVHGKRGWFTMRDVLGVQEGRP